MPIHEIKGAATQRKVAHEPNSSSTGISRQGPSAKPHTVQVVGDIILDENAISSKKNINQNRDQQNNNPIVNKKKKTSTATRLFFVSLILLSGALAYSYFSASDLYSVEARLVFVPTDFKTTAERPMDKEIELLKNPNISLLIAQQSLKQNSNFDSEIPAHSLWNTAAATSASDLPEKSLANNKFGSTAEFIKWVGDNLVVEGAIEKGKATAKLKLAGEDPEFLKQVLNTYVKCYSDYRRSLDDEISVPGPRNAPSSASMDNLNEQISKVDLQFRECDLALKLIESRKGVFSGFIPDAKIGGIPSLSHFQRRIVELEINRRALNVRFTPNSREIKNIDYEIQQIRDAMRECITEHMHFLSKGKELLVAQKQEMERKAGITDKCQKGKCSGSLPNGESWFYVSDGLKVISGQPNVAEKPMVLRAQELKKALSAYINSPFDSAELKFFFGSHPDCFEENCPSEVQKPETQFSKIESSQLSRAVNE